MREIHRVSRRYIACVEYFADSPEEVTYRGESGRMWRRDYGSAYMDLFSLKLLGNGFFWKREGYPDNLTWWLFEKVATEAARAHDASSAACSGENSPLTRYDPDGPGPRFGPRRIENV